MASRGKMGAMVLVALGSLALQACVAVPVRDGRYHRAYGYGGSGLVSNVNPQQAERECIRTARDFRGYRGVRSEGVGERGRSASGLGTGWKDRGESGGCTRVCRYPVRVMSALQMGH